ncbi:hypothetical protein BABINDRAFT_161492 [Babjeviella inositovora NRRL Y-12698]|uniref:Transcription factor Iwr1 domain-containing protein n=1 Tax=Babjeviella inositovora NRRL Y-12698 TaxID=984486 RepID=A0A1E3QS81_9ASCO|nr:uncharacterized protein BABINDRAFT_161492 [Babjeviella inositovora NRRL Y-12698]ODQ79797.1 hypothetical protein BABINDRAFT_161492 [Babjeviella inositovora NRRL Y-12698]
MKNILSTFSIPIRRREPSVTDTVSETSGKKALFPPKKSRGSISKLQRPASNKQPSLDSSSSTPNIIPRLQKGKTPKRKSRKGLYTKTPQLATYTVSRPAPREDRLLVTFDDEIHTRKHRDDQFSTVASIHHLVNDEDYHGNDTSVLNDYNFEKHFASQGVVNLLNGISDVYFYDSAQEFDQDDEEDDYKDRNSNYSSEDDLAREEKEGWWTPEWIWVNRWWDFTLR